MSESLPCDDAKRTRRRANLLYTRACPSLVCLILIASACPALADNSNTLDKLEIIGTDQSTGKVVADEHTGSTAHIQREHIERAAPQLGELLASQAGIQQRQSGGFGSFSSINVRADGSAQLGIYLDGVLLNSSANPVVDLSSLEILNLGAVDIYRGVTPLQLGHGSMAGAVNLISMGSISKPETRIRLSAGGFSQAGLQLSHQGDSGAWDWTGSVSRQQSDNDFPFINNNGTPLEPIDDAKERRHNNGVVRSAGLLKAGYEQSPTRRTDATLQIADREIGVPEWRNRKDNQASFDSQSAQLQLSQVIDGWYSWNTRHSIYWHQFDTDYNDSLGQVGQGGWIRNDTQTIGAKTYWERFADFGTIGVSLGLREESLTSSDIIEEEKDFSASRKLLLSTVHLAWIDKTDRWLLTPAIRWQHSSRNGQSNSTSVSGPLSPSKEIDLGLQLGLSFKASKQVTLNANAGRFFREPSFGELYGSIGLVKNNPLLLPEAGNNVDVSVVYQKKSLKLEATAFHNRRDNLIVTTYDSREIGRPSNTGKAFINGLELSTRWQPHQRWQVQVNATFQNPRNKNSIEAFENRVLPGKARRLYFARLKYQPSAFSIWYEWSSNQQRFYDTANTRPAEDTSVHDIGLNWANKQWQLSTRLHNLNDENVEDFYGYAKPGRSWSIAITRTL